MAVHSRLPVVSIAEWLILASLISGSASTVGGPQQWFHPSIHIYSRTQNLGQVLIAIAIFNLIRAFNLPRGPIKTLSSAGE